MLYYPGEESEYCELWHWSCNFLVTGQTQTGVWHYLNNRHYALCSMHDIEVRLLCHRYRQYLTLQVRYRQVSDIIWAIDIMFFAWCMTLKLRLLCHRYRQYLTLFEQKNLFSLFDVWNDFIDHFQTIGKIFPRWLGSADHNLALRELGRIVASIYHSVVWLEQNNIFVPCGPWSCENIEVLASLSQIRTISDITGQIQTGVWHYLNNRHYVLCSMHDIEVLTSLSQIQAVSDITGQIQTGIWHYLSNRHNVLCSMYDIEVTTSLSRI